MDLESSVLFRYLLLLTEVLLLRYLSLKGPSVKPMYVFVSLLNDGEGVYNVSILV